MAPHSSPQPIFVVGNLERSTAMSISHLKIRHLRKTHAPGCAIMIGSTPVLQYFGAPAVSRVRALK
jgi:hypothetical protein